MAYVGIASDWMNVQSVVQTDYTDEVHLHSQWQAASYSLVTVLFVLGGRESIRG